MRTIERLTVARRAHEFTLEIYKVTSRFPPSERFGLTSQLRRASVSVGSNIAEGDSSGSSRQFARYLSLAKASTGELAYQLLLAKDLGYLDGTTYERLSAEVNDIGAMLVGLVRRVKAGAQETPSR